MTRGTFQEELKGIDIPIHQGEFIPCGDNEHNVNVYKLGEGKRSSGVFLLNHAEDAFVVKFYEQISSYENDIAALKQLHKVLDNNPGLNINAIRPVTPVFEVPRILIDQHEKELNVHLSYIAGSTLEMTWKQLPREFKSRFIESLKKLESYFKETYLKNGFKVWTQLKTRKRFFSQRTPTLRMSVTDRSGKCIRHSLHGGNFVLTKQHELFIIDPR